MYVILLLRSNSLLNGKLIGEIQLASENVQKHYTHMPCKELIL